MRLLLVFLKEKFVELHCNLFFLSSIFNAKYINLRLKFFSALNKSMLDPLH